MEFYKNLFVVLLFSSLCNSTPEIFYTSIPKSGNFLLQKCMSLMTNKRIISSNNRLFLDENQISKLRKNTILDSHIFCNKKNENLILKNNMKGIFIYRDPRDQIVSFIFYIYKLYSSGKIIFKNDFYKLAKLSFDELFFKIINNYETFYRIWNINHNHIPLKIGKVLNKNINIAGIYKKYEGWHNNKLVYVTTFEKLVGPKGGGNLEIQLNEIKNIASHLNIELTDSQVKNVANNLFGGTYTFREGQIGGWKKFFTQKHKNAFKKVAGNLLVELGYEKNLNW